MTVGAPLRRSACLCLSVLLLNGCAWMGWGKAKGSTPQAQPTEVVCPVDAAGCVDEASVPVVDADPCDYLFENHQGVVLDPSEDLADGDFSVYFARLKRRFEVPRYAEYVDLGHAPLADGAGVIAEIAVSRKGKPCRMYINALRVLD